MALAGRAVLDPDRIGVFPLRGKLLNVRDASITQISNNQEIQNIKKFMEGFQYDAHPMGILLSTVGCLSTIYPDAKRISSEESRRLQIRRLIAKVPTIAAWAYRHSIGRPYNYPDNDLSFTGNFLNMLFKMTELKYRPHPVLERALDILFILHADH